MTDLEPGVVPWLGAPFVPKGRTPAGWDCWGCAGWLSVRLLDRALPDYASAYAAADVTSEGAARRADAIAARLGDWREVARGTPEAIGAVALFRWLGRAGHVGLALNERRFVHADWGCGTVIADFDAPPWRRRLLGLFVPRCE